MEIAFSAIVLAQVGLIWYVLNSQKEERAKMLNAIIAKDAQELATLELVDKEEPKKQPKTEEEMTPIENLSDDDFAKHVLKD